MTRVALVLLVVLTAVTCAKADGIAAGTYQVTSGVISLNNLSSSGSWSLSGGGFALSGSGEVGVCGIETPVGQPIVPCSSGLPIIGQALVNGVQSINFDSLFSATGVVPITPGDVAQITVIEPVSFSGLLLACPSVCPGPAGTNFFFSLDGDVGYLTMVLTETDQSNTLVFEHTSTTYTITGPPNSVAEPTTLTLLSVGLLGLALRRIFSS